MLDNTVLVYGEPTTTKCESRSPPTPTSTASSRAESRSAGLHGRQGIHHAVAAYLWPATRPARRQVRAVGPGRRELPAGCFGWTIHPSNFFVTSPTGKAAPPTPEARSPTPVRPTKAISGRSHNIQGQWLVFVSTHRRRVTTHSRSSTSRPQLQDDEYSSLNCRADRL